MRFLKTALFLLIACFTIIACKIDKKKTNSSESTSSSLDVNQVATELCACMQPLIDLNKQIQELAEAGKTDEISSLITEVERLSTEGEACTERLEAKYGEVKGTNEKKVEAAMAKTCPEVAKMLSVLE